jgi:hypothetical protein
MARLFIILVVMNAQIKKYEPVSAGKRRKSMEHALDDVNELQSNSKKMNYKIIQLLLYIYMSYRS